MKITQFGALSSILGDKKKWQLPMFFLIAFFFAWSSSRSQGQLTTSPLYEKAAKSLRSAPIKEYEFDKASVRDVLRFLADDAGIDFVAMPEEGNDGAKLITFSLRKSPFSALETIAKMNGVTLVYEDEIWHMRPLSDKSLIARTYKIRFNTGEINNSSGNSISGVTSNSNRTSFNGSSTGYSGSSYSSGKDLTSSGIS